MAGTDTKPDGLAGLEAGLDALDAVQVRRTPVREVLLRKVLPPVLAVALVVVVWQLLVESRVTDDYKLPSPGAVWSSAVDMWLRGTLLDVVWTSISRGLLGFLLAVAIGTPLGLLVARVRFVRAAIGPILSGLQSLPSVAWVAPAVIWLGLNDKMMYAVILLGAVPSVANGLVSGVDQVPPLFLRAGRTLGATGLRGTWHIVLPAALPGYLAGLKQGWAFSALADGRRDHRVLPRPRARARAVAGKRPQQRRHARHLPGHHPDPVRRHRDRPADLQSAGAVGAAQPRSPRQELSHAMSAPVLLVIAHGSRDPRHAATVHALTARVRSLRPGLRVETGFLDFNAPSVPRVLERLAAQGAGAVIALPLLLTRAFHAKSDIPTVLHEARTRLPRMRIRQAEVLGPSPLLNSALERRLHEAGIRPGDRGSTGLVLASAGSTDPEAIAVIAEIARELRHTGWCAVRPAFASASLPAPRTPYGSCVPRAYGGWRWLPMSSHPAGSRTASPRARPGRTCWPMSSARHRSWHGCC